MKTVETALVGVELPLRRYVSELALQTLQRNHPPRVDVLEPLLYALPKHRASRCQLRWIYGLHQIAPGLKIMRKPPILPAPGVTFVALKHNFHFLLTHSAL